MTSLFPRMGRFAAACALALSAGVQPVHAARRGAPAVPVADTTVTRASAPLPLTADAGNARQLALTRAAFEHARGDFAAVVRHLAPLALESSPPFPDADRAAFLLGHAWLRLGQRERFLELARATCAWPTPSPFTRWLAFELRLSGGAGRAADSAARSGQTAADALAANQLLRDGNAEAVLTLAPAGTRDLLLVQLRAVALSRLGRDDTPELQWLAGADSASALGRDLAGAALLQLATRAADKGGDPRPLLARVPAGSRYAARAAHMSALSTLERGGAAAARALLQPLALDTAYAGRREATLTLAGQAMDQGNWDLAFTLYAHADTEWIRERDVLRQDMAPSAAAGLWSAWEHDRSLASALVLDGMPAEALTERLALEAANLSASPASSEPVLGLPAPLDSNGTTVPPPPAEAWDRVASSMRELSAAHGRLALVSDSLARERDWLADQRRYFGWGLSEVREEAGGLATRTTRLDTLRARMDQTAQRLMRMRDAATLRFQRRAATVLARLESHERWIRAMKRFWVDGPDAARHAAAPPGWKGPDVALAQEAELTQKLQWSAGRMQAETPRRIAAAYEKVWGPRLIDRANLLADGAHEALAWSKSLAATVDSTLGTVRTSREEQRLGPLAEELARRAGALAQTAAELRASVARDAVQQALVALQTEREGLDYGLAAAAYARAVKLSAADTMAVAANVAEGAHADTSFEVAADSVSRRDREEAVSRASIFLVDHPDSPARAEMRFRLADLLVSTARADFRNRMKEWLAAQSQGRVLPLPLVDHAQAMTLYKHILAEDPDFAHRDAVMFNAGMLLADTGDPAAAGYFTRLLDEFPASAYVQEASLRLGDLAFDATHVDEAVAHYQHAAAGPDPSLQAIALYKTGWAHYDGNRFGAAATAFRGVLDLYAGNARLSVQADIEHEAEQYFVYSLAAAGGAKAYEQSFPSGHEPPYARRVLRAMGQHFRRYGQMDDAITADELYLKRWPADVAALEVAGRLADTQHRAERPLDERATRLAWAEQFAPGGAWAAAQGSDSVRTAGAEFARVAWRDVAFEHHRKARATGSRDEWRAALKNYETLLGRWPSDSSAAVFELHAGEACAELGDYPASLAHYRAATDLGRDSAAVRAAWQQVAVTDRWYESTRPAAVRDKATGPGSDSLARAVITIADRLLEREPKHPQAADLVWRECQLTLAHGWNDQALIQLARFARTYPQDRRAPLAAVERAEVYFREADYAAAGDAFEDALVTARRAGADTLARRVEKALPVCALREAEAAVASDSTAHGRHAQLFEEVARRWPAYEHATAAQYRAGLAWLEAGRTKEGVRALQLLTERWPAHPLARESRLRIAKAYEGSGDNEHAAVAWLEFSKAHPEDPNADEAWLKSADLCDSAGLGSRADDLRAQYLKRWPDDQESALEILETLARKELAALPAERPVSSLLPVVAARTGTGRSTAKAAPASPASWLAQYMKRVAKTPVVASKPLFAELRFRFGEEAYQKYSLLALTQPLPKSIAAKQEQLDSVLVRYRRTADLGVPEWTHAATYRIGEALVGFGEALEKSERPKDLTGDDLLAYENVLLEQGQTFRGRGETVWSDLLDKSRGSVADAWTTRARGSLWAHLGERFLFQPESDFPVVEATGPGRARARGARDGTPASARTDSTQGTQAASEGHDQ